MKKIVQTCVILCFCMNISAQINLEQEFKEFIVNFDMCRYPFYVAWGENEENSECETEHGGGISKKHYQWFVKEQGLKPFAWGCDMDQFLNYVALLQLPPTDSSYLLIFGLNLEEVSCGDGLLLASYSKKTFQLQDTLTIYSYGSMNAQYIDRMQILQNVFISCYLSEHSFQIHRKEGFFLIKTMEIRN